MCVSIWAEKSIVSKVRIDCDHTFLSHTLSRGMAEGYEAMRGAENEYGDGVASAAKQF